MPKLIDHDARERDIGEAAWRLLAREGLMAMSVRKVAAESGIAAASLRQSFATQSALRAYCLRLVQLRAAERIGALNRATSAADFARAALSELLPLDDERALELEVQVTLWTLSRTDSAIEAAYREANRAIEQLCLVLVQLLVDSDSRCAWMASDVAAHAGDMHVLVDGLAVKLLWGPKLSPADASALASSCLGRYFAYLRTRSATPV
jgi:AcrR family transcriptional regulator